MAVAEKPSAHDGRRRDGLLAGELARATRELVEDALAWTMGHQVQASKLLGCNKVSLWRMISQFGIDIEDVAKAARDGRWAYKTRPEGAPWVSESNESTP